MKFKILHNGEDYIIRRKRLFWWFTIKELVKDDDDDFNVEVYTRKFDSYVNAILYLEQEFGNKAIIVRKYLCTYL